MIIYELEQLASSNNQFVVQFQDVLVGCALRIANVIRTHDSCSYELEQLVSDNDTKVDSYTY
jgi:hypothetical protein